MNKLLNLLFFIPIAVVLIVLSVANRQSVRLSLDPFNSEIPAMSVSLPFFVYLFAALILGLFLGSMVTWFRQGKYRKELRNKSDEAHKLQVEAEALKQQNQSEKNEIAPGLPTVSHQKTAA